MTGVKGAIDLEVYPMRRQEIGLARFGVFLLLSSTILAGCVLKDPLSNPDQAKLDDRLIGAWKYEGEKSKDENWILFVGKADLRHAPPGIMKAVSVENDREKQIGVRTHYFFPTCLSEVNYANLLDENPLDGEKEKTWNENRVQQWLLIKYSVEIDRLTIWFLDASAVEKAVTRGEVKGIVEEKGLLKIKRTVFTDPKDLSRFLVNGGDKKLFSHDHKMVFSRIK
jgi:hypothetical protein